MDLTYSSFELNWPHGFQIHFTSPSKWQVKPRSRVSGVSRSTSRSDRIIQSRFRRAVLAETQVELTRVQISATWADKAIPRPGVRLSDLLSVYREMALPEGRHYQVYNRRLLYWDRSMFRYKFAFDPHQNCWDTILF